jgi:hypothetical protein
MDAEGHWTQFRDQWGAHNSYERDGAHTCDVANPEFAVSIPIATWRTINRPTEAELSALRSKLEEEKLQWLAEAFSHLCGYFSPDDDIDWLKANREASGGSF